MVHARSLQVERSHSLMSHVLFRVNDLDEARERVANVFSPHDLRVLATGKALDARMCHVPIGNVSLNRLDYGATVHVDPGPTRDFFLVMMPLAGMSEVTCGKESIRSNSRWAAVVTPTLGLRMRMQHGCDQIVVRVDRALLERYCAQHLHRDLRRPLEFRLGMDMESSQAGSWCRLIELLVSASGQEHGMLASPLVRAHFEQTIVDALLFCQPNTYTEDLLRPAPPIAPHCVKRAEEYIRAHADRPMTIVELAEYAGASTRALYAGFQNFRSMSPMAFLKAVRLERVREELMSDGARRETVTAIAMRWGFGHLGHFTTDYKRKFGETPSQTRVR